MTLGLIVAAVLAVLAVLFVARPFLRERHDDAVLAELIRQTVWDKWEGHEINNARFIKPARTMHTIGG